ncbi:MAG: hypothetical protein ACYDC1_16735 [Limisphaerales bacterium]
MRTLLEPVSRLFCSTSTPSRRQPRSAAGWRWIALLLLAWPLEASAAEDLFIIQVQVRIQAHETYRREDRASDGWLGQETDRTDSCDYTFSAEHRIEWVDDGWRDVGFSQGVVTGGGQMRHVRYDRANVPPRPPEEETLDWTYRTDPTAYDPEQSNVTVLLSSPFEECLVIPDPLVPADLTVISGGQAQAGTLNGLFLGTPLHYTPIVLPTDQPSYTINRTVTTNHTRPYTGNGESGQLTITYQSTVTVQRNPVELEAVILPDPPGGTGLEPYAAWLPKAGAHEDLPGSLVKLRVIVRRKGSSDTNGADFVDAKFFCRLNDVTREPGICLNFPPKDRAVVSADLLFHPDDGLMPSDGGLAVESVRDDLNELDLVIEAFDYGAYGTLSVTAQVRGVGELKAFVEGHPNQFFLRLPQDDNENRIGDAWEKEAGIYGWNLSPDSDQDRTPSGQRNDGDGLSVYEEYRGFMVKGIHHRLDPRWKDLFIHDPDGLVLFTLTAGGKVADLYRAARVFPHLLRATEWTGSGTAAAEFRRVNFNTSGFAHVVDQHGLEVRLERGWMSTDYREGDFGKVYAEDYLENRPSYGEWGDPLNAQPATTFFERPDADRPRDAEYALVRPEGIKQNIWSEVRYHTRALPLFAPLFDPSLPSNQRKTLNTLLDQATDQFIAEHTQDGLEAYRRWVGLVVTHELGHGVGTDDHQPNLFKGDRGCVMRYLSPDDLARNPQDRFGLERRVWANGFCTTADACKHRIQVSDRTGIGASPGAANPLVGPAAHRLSQQDSRRSDDGAPLFPFQNPELVTPAEALELGIGLAWNPTYAGDPLDVIVRLDAARFQQTLVLELGGTTMGSAGMNQQPLVATAWAEGVSLELARMGIGQTREVVLAPDAWPALRRRAASQAAWSDLPLAVSTAEWAVPASTASLTPGVYQLTARWNGQGLADTNLLPAGGIILAPAWIFEVLEATNHTARADQLGRLALAAKAAGDPNTARSLAAAALQLDEGGTGVERMGTFRLLAGLAFEQRDYPAAFRALSALTQQTPVQDVAYVAARNLQALRPELRLPAVAAGPLRTLHVFGWPDQLVEAEQSRDLISWRPAAGGRIGPEGLLMLTPEPASDARPCFYRAIWRP